MAWTTLGVVLTRIGVSLMLNTNGTIALLACYVHVFKCGLWFNQILSFCPYR